jgi:hypothetical protein
MKVPLDYARGTLRLSVGRFTTLEEVDEAADLISSTVIELVDNKQQQGGGVKEDEEKEAPQKKAKTNKTNSN